MTLPNEVKFKVRAIALDLEIFTVAQMVRVTALNPASIRTELQRMKREGYLTSEPVHERKSGSGAPPHRYQLTDDPEKRLDLARSIEPFFSPSTPPSSRPLSLHYQAVLALAERLEAENLSEADRETVLHEARRHLTLAAEEEGIDIRPATETAVSGAHIDLSRARLAMATGLWDEAERWLATARKTFREYGLEEQASQADSLQAALVVERMLDEAPADLLLSDRLLAALREMLGTLPIPTVRRMLRALHTPTGPYQRFSQSRGEGKRSTHNDSNKLFSKSREVVKKPRPLADPSLQPDVNDIIIARGHHMLPFSPMKPNEVWQAALGELQLQMTRETFTTWLKPTRVISYEDGTLIIGVENGYVKEWLSNRLLATIQRTVTSIVGQTVDVKFVTQSKRSKFEEQLADFRDSDPVPLVSQTQSLVKSGAPFNPRYRFDSFVVGASNRLAHAASLAVAEQPATAYNPLFLYGGVGLGKTHLLHAIGYECLAKGLQVLYVSSEGFTNDLINAIRTHTTDSFREKYRSNDVLLIDDIQFITGKESTQEEFFHTFNTLHGANKQIVVSSDRPPRAMVTLEERLRARFEWGLTADIQPPDLETRIAILSSKAKAQPIDVPRDLLYFIARQIQNNIRELERALNRVLAYVRLTGYPLTIKTAELALTDMLTRTVILTPEEIVEEVARYYNLEADSLRGRSRSKEIARSRQVAMYLAREETRASLPQISEAIDRDQTTVLYGHNKISHQIEEDDGLRRDILTIRKRLHNRSPS